MYKSHGILSSPDTSVPLNPLSSVLQSGQLCNPAKSAVRALQVLELLANADTPLRAVDISSALDYSPSSAHQLLQTMVDAAYLILNPITKRYAPSPRVANLGAGDEQNCRPYGPVRALMHSTQRAVGVCVSITTCQGSLSSARGAFMQILDNAGDNRAAGRNGMRAPLFGTSAGAVWLASQTDEVARGAIRLCRRELGEHGNDAGKLMENLRRVRTLGYAFGGLTDGERERTVSMALPASRNGIVLVMCAFGAAEDMQNRKDDVVATMKERIQTFFPAPSIAPAV